jgi:hypothetical protein
VSTQLESGGPRAHVYVDTTHGAFARATVTNQRHTTGMYSVNYAGEAVPPYYMFDSDAKEKKQQKVDAAWVCGLPRVQGLFGYQHQVTLEPGYSVTTKGGTCDGEFLEWISKCIDQAYPNIAPKFKYDENGERDADGLLPILEGPVIIKTDFGPDRLVGHEDGLMKRKAQYERGVLPWGGVPNGTAATQEMDDLFGDLKEGGRKQAKLIVAEKRKARRAAIAAARKAKQKIDGKKLSTVSLNNFDLPRIVNGKPNDKGKLRPFNYAFGKATIGKTLDKLGYIDSKGWVTGACVNHPKVQPTAVASGSAAAEGGAAAEGDAAAEGGVAAEGGAEDRSARASRAQPRGGRRRGAQHRGPHRRDEAGPEDGASARARRRERCTPDGGRGGVFAAQGDGRDADERLHVRGRR